MRSIAVFALLAASWALLFQSPSAYAAPAPSKVDSAGSKRFCIKYNCRVEDVDPNTDTTSKSGVEKLAGVLIDALEMFQTQNEPLSSNTSDTTVNLETPEDTGVGPVPVVDVIELADAAL